MIRRNDKYETSKKGRATRKRYKSSAKGRALQMLRRRSPHHMWGPRLPPTRGIEADSLKAITDLCAHLRIDVASFKEKK